MAQLAYECFSNQEVCDSNPPTPIVLKQKRSVRNIEHIHITQYPNFLAFFSIRQQKERKKRKRTGFYRENSSTKVTKPTRIY